MRIGRYEVTGKLGQGGSGVVFAARGAEGEVAIKLLARATYDTLARFERETRLQARLGAVEGFVPLLEVGECEAGPFLVMPLLRGGTLRDRLHKGPPGVDRAIALGIELARSLGHAHAAGIVHRDLKPENILFDDAGRPLVADLGLAKHFKDSVAGASQSVSISIDGALRGTVGYMAPEQANDAKSVGPEADVFALGAIIYECVSGRPAFAGATPLELLARLQEGRVEPLDAPRWLAAIAERALAHEPEARFASGEELARALEARGAPARRAGRRIVAVFALLAGALVAAWVGSLAAPRAPRPARVEPRPAPPPPPPRVEAEPGEPPMSDDERRFVTELSLSDHASVEGLDGLNVVIAVNPTWIHTRALRAEVRLYRYDDREAAAEIDELMKKFPRFARLHVLRAQVAWRRNERRAALEAVETAVRLAPEDGEARAYRASYTFHERFDSGATLTPAVLHQVVEDGGKALLSVQGEPRILALTTLGFAHQAESDWSAAADCWDQILAVVRNDSRRVMALTQGAFCRFMRGDLVAARTLSDAAIAIEPASPDAYAVRGLVRESDDPTGAIADWEKSLSLAPTQPNAEAFRGRIARLKGAR